LDEKRGDKEGKGLFGLFAVGEFRGGGQCLTRALSHKESTIGGLGKGFNISANKRHKNTHDKEMGTKNH